MDGDEIGCKLRGIMQMNSEHTQWGSPVYFRSFKQIKKKRNKIKIKKKQQKKTKQTNMAPNSNFEMIQIRRRGQGGGAKG